MYKKFYGVKNAGERIVIDVALSDYMDFFHEWDNATFRKRDMHPELAEFLELCSADIPLKQKLTIRFYVENEEKDDARERMIVESFRTYYGFFGRTQKKKAARNFHYAMLLLAISLTLIFAQAILGTIIQESIWTSVFLEGLMIGGWVFMWEALHMVAFESQALFKHAKEIERFLEAELLFRYEDPAPG
ncbi:hypothetical protein [Anaerotalea alkaliphila]|uniref:Uncharacterized protein n=1 Tax=Anaerotalea alkaliphila TaxID=2662126 RepID=A0A7X5KNZ3_9FIRM|nr:hypothetical protein [Anaerotalea alkaliphila]NDL67262.1 hypothetical protein [Anaerotalea alkaliphila]